MTTGTRAALLTLGCSFAVFGAMLWVAFVYDRGQGVELPSVGAAGAQGAARGTPPLLAPTAGPPTAGPARAAAAATALPGTPAPGAPDPAAPGAVDLQVPASQRAAPFDQPRRLNVPPGFELSVFAAGLQGARFMAIGPQGDLFLSQPGAGVVALPDRDHDGVADAVVIAAAGLNQPHGLAWQDGTLYIANTDSVVRARDDNGDLQADAIQTIVPSLPSGKGHSTRTVVVGADGKLYVSIGSSCNVCREQDGRRASIMRYNLDGSGEEQYARGLRNAVGLRVNPADGQLWATNNGRDWLGDDLPPEIITPVHLGDDYGWPRCNNGRMEDPDFGSPGSCDGVAAPAVEVQAHTAPLGLEFTRGEAFPASYRGLVVALHGSWNRSTPTGNEVILVRFDPDGHGRAFDLVTGWLEQGRWGRPVDVLQAPDGSLFISDDTAGAVYRLRWVGTP